MFTNIISLLIGYAFGCLQSSYLLGKAFRGIDIREHGARNAGASNATFIMGWKLGLLTALGDVLKAFLAVFLVRYLWPDAIVTQFIAGVGAFLGHCYPFYMQFRGGKGTACMIGITLALDWRIGLIYTLTLIATALISNYIAIGTVCSYLSLFGSLIFFDYPGAVIVLAAILFAISFQKHFVNYVRIANGKEVLLRSFLAEKNPLKR